MSTSEIKNHDDLIVNEINQLVVTEGVQWNGACHIAGELVHNLCSTLFPPDSISQNILDKIMKEVAAPRFISALEEQTLKDESADDEQANTDSIKENVIDHQDYSTPEGQLKLLQRSILMESEEGDLLAPWKELFEVLQIEIYKVYSDATNYMEGEEFIPLMKSCFPSRIRIPMVLPTLERKLIDNFGRESFYLEDYRDVDDNEEEVANKENTASSARKQHKSVSFSVDTERNEKKKIKKSKKSATTVKSENQIIKRIKTKNKKLVLKLTKPSKSNKKKQENASTITSNFGFPEGIEVPSRYQTDSGDNDDEDALASQYGLSKNETVLVRYTKGKYEASAAVVKLWESSEDEEKLNMIVVFQVPQLLFTYDYRKEVFVEFAKNKEFVNFIFRVPFKARALTVFWSYVDGPLDQSTVLSVAPPSAASPRRVKCAFKSCSYKYFTEKILETEANECPAKTNLPSISDFLSWDDRYVDENFDSYMDKDISKSRKNKKDESNFYTNLDFLLRTHIGVDCYGKNVFFYENTTSMLVSGVINGYSYNIHEDCFMVHLGCSKSDHPKYSSKKISTATTKTEVAVDYPFYVYASWCFAQTSDTEWSTLLTKKAYPSAIKLMTEIDAPHNPTTDEKKRKREDLSLLQPSIDDKQPALKKVVKPIDSDVE